MPDLTMTAALIAFSGGLLSILTPCSIMMLPGYASFVTGQVTRDNSRGSALRLSLSFIAGFSLFFIALGINVSLLGQLLWKYQQALNVVAGF